MTKVVTFQIELENGTQLEIKCKLEYINVDDNDFVLGDIMGGNGYNGKVEYEDLCEMFSIYYEKRFGNGLKSVKPGDVIRLKVDINSMVLVDVV